MIIQCQCGQKNRVPEKPRLSSSYRCGLCGRDLRLSANADPFIDTWEYPKNQPKRIRRLDLKSLTIFLVVVGIILYNAWHDSVRQPTQSTEPTGVTVPATTTPAEAKKQEIVDQDAGKLGNPELNNDYQEVNARYFGNKLPEIPVLWEPKLEEVGPLVGKDYIEKGLASRNPELILLNPTVRPDQAELRRVLCHEMVHIYLFTIGDMKTDHGPAFQGELSRLSRAGAFQGIPATEDEKLTLRSWLNNQKRKLHAESVELKRKNTELDRAGEEIDRQQKLVEQEHDGLNLRITLANERRNGWPTEDEIDAFKAKCRMLNQRIDDFKAKVAVFNASVANHNATLKKYNHEAWRYNLMMAYPDGLDEDSRVQVEVREVNPRGPAATPPSEKISLLQATGASKLGGPN